MRPIWPASTLSRWSDCIRTVGSRHAKNVRSRMWQAAVRGGVLGMEARPIVYRDTEVFAVRVPEGSMAAMQSQALGRGGMKGDYEEQPKYRAPPRKKKSLSAPTLQRSGPHRRNSLGCMSNGPWSWTDAQQLGLQVF